MKKCFLLTIVMALVAMVVCAENLKVVNLKFAKNQFSFVKNSVGTTLVSTSEYPFWYEEDAVSPGLPLVSVNVRIPNGMEFKSVAVTMKDELLSENIIVATTPVAVPTNCSVMINNSTELPTYKKCSYPNENVRYLTTSHADGFTILRFAVCPFKYSASDKKLYLLNNVTLNIELKDEPSVQTESYEYEGQNLGEILNSQIVNADDFPKQDFATYGQNLSPGTGTILPGTMGTVFAGYTIITSESLASGFESLAKWKKIKGLNSKIVTVEEIKSLYPTMNPQLAIKTYLKEQYTKNRLRYVLFGGDDTIVPVQYCYYPGHGLSTEIPTDLFYACFDKDFSWNANGNNRYGEVADNIDFTPSVFITRVPVRTHADVLSFVNRILSYEKTPIMNIPDTWNGDMLMAGYKLSDYVLVPGHSDTEFLGRKMYDESIAPYWAGTRKLFYDTYTDFAGGASYDMINENLQEQLSKGYSFVDMISHGGPESWLLEYRKQYYAKEASELKNSGYSVIVTNSCLTNAFDSSLIYDGVNYDPCLSEAFIRNYDSGVVAYFGCSREGYYYPNEEELGPSQQYNAAFYKALFSATPVNKNFGEVVAAAKSAMINSCNYEGAFRRLQFGLNPIGDPETPIYTAKPQYFSNVMVSYSKDGKSFTLDTGIDSCKICYMSKEDNGESTFVVRQNVRRATFDINELSNLCITKQNYIPYVRNILPGVISKNCISSCSASRENNTATIAIQLEENVKNAKIIIASASADNKKEYTVTSDNPVVTTDISNSNSGVHVVSLFVDGKLVDSSSFIKK